jgi:hypothetical protein
MARDDEHRRLGPGCVEERLDALADLEVDRLDGFAELLGGRRVVPRLVGVEEMPELMADAMGLAEAANEQVPLLAAE